jgi:hypothetical protein
MSNPLRNYCGRYLANLGHQIDKITVRNILRRHHMEPAPQRRKGGMGWAQFLKLHWEVLAATDFFTVEVATWHGLVTYYITHHGSRAAYKQIRPRPQMGEAHA